MSKRRCSLARIRARQGRSWRCTRCAALVGPRTAFPLGDDRKMLAPGLELRRRGGFVAIWAELTFRCSLREGNLAMRWTRPMYPLLPADKIFHPSWYRSGQVSRRSVMISKICAIAFLDAEMGPECSGCPWPSISANCLFRLALFPLLFPLPLVYQLFSSMSYSAEPRRIPHSAFRGLT